MQSTATQTGAFVKRTSAYEPPFTVSEGQAALCADFMLDMDPAELSAPLSVLDALAEYETKQHGALTRLARAIESWMVIDRAACVALLGPGLGVEQ